MEPIRDGVQEKAQKRPNLIRILFIFFVVFVSIIFVNLTIGLVLLLFVWPLIVITGYFADALETNSSKINPGDLKTGEKCVEIYSAIGWQQGGMHTFKGYTDCVLTLTSERLIIENKPYEWRRIYFIPLNDITGIEVKPKNGGFDCTQKWEAIIKTKSADTHSFEFNSKDEANKLKRDMESNKTI